MQKTSTKDYLIPSRLETVLYLAVTIVVLFVANLNFLTTYLLHDTGNVPQTGSEAFQMYSSGFFGFIEGLPFVPSSAVFIFWSLTGLVIFSLAQSVYNVYAEVKDDIAVDTHYMHPSNYTRWQFWVEVLVQFTAHLLIYGLIILWGLLLGFVLIPVSGALLQQLFSSITPLGVVIFATSFVLLYVGILVLAILLKLFFKRKQLII